MTKKNICILIKQILINTNKYKFRKNNKSKTFNTLTEALCYKFIMLLK